MSGVGIMYNKKNLVVLVICIFVLFIVIGYSAFSALLISDGFVSVSDTVDVRFTKISNIETIGSASDNDESPSIIDNSLFIDVNLMHTNDSITYQAILINDSNNSVYIKELNIVEDGSSSVISSVIGINKCDVLLAKESKVITVTISYDSNVNSQNYLTNKVININVVAEPYTSNTTCSSDDYTPIAVGSLN